ncbi:MAG: hypothetical protein QG599_3604 [Pseudomonadota bacterium]|nr:hypothetical protein [Pseudomonadota bacterium]
MPMLIELIDKIARDKQRDVLYLIFCEDSSSCDHLKPIDYENCEIRNTLIQWFSDNNITAYPCGPFVRESIMIGGYHGQLYIDIPFDKSNLDYQKVEQLLENEDGSMKFPQVLFAYLSLELAMVNAYQDDPAYWESLDL